MKYIEIAFTKDEVNSFVEEKARELLSFGGREYDASVSRGDFQTSEFKVFFEKKKPEPVKPNVTEPTTQSDEVSS